MFELRVEFEVPAMSESGGPVRKYDEPVEVKRGSQAAVVADQEAPAQFLWRGRLWRVTAVLAYWVESAAWWSTPAVRRVLGIASAEQDQPREIDLTAEQETWRVEAAQRPGQTPGVFDLTFDWSAGTWRLARCWD